MEKYYQKINWLIVIIAIITTTALTIYYSFAFGEDFSSGFKDLLQSVIPNLVAVLLAIPIVYFFFTARGISPNEELKQDIIRGISSLGNENSGFRDSIEVNAEFNFTSRAETAKQIDIIALSAYNFLTTFRPQITTALGKGCTIRVLTVEPQSDASQLIMMHQERKEIEPDLERMLGRIEQIKQSFSGKKIKGKMEVRGINWIPSCSLIIVDRKSIESNMRVKVYPISIDIPLPQIKTHLIISKRIRPGLFSYFLQHFEIQWNNSKSITEIS